MRRILVAVVLLATGLALYWLSPRDTVQQLHGRTMGTTYSIKWVGEPLEIQAQVDAELERINALASTWRTDSQLSQLNANARGQWQPASAQLLTMLRFAADLHRKSGGRYDVSIGPLVQLWGFGSSGERFSPPLQQDIDRVRETVGFARVGLEAGRVRIPAGMSLELSSIAKGYAVDRLAELMHSRGVTRYIAEIGGELRVSGSGPGQRPWRIGVESPQRAGQAQVRLSFSQSAALATSGDYNNAFVHEGRQYGHLIDPISGWPVSHAASVTVVAPTCMVADAWATALAVLPPEEAFALAVDEGLAVYFIWRLPDDNVRTGQTPAWQKWNTENP